MNCGHHRGQAHKAASASRTHSSSDSSIIPLLLLLSALRWSSCMVSGHQRQRSTSPSFFLHLLLLRCLCLLLININTPPESPPLQYPIDTFSSPLSPFHFAIIHAIRYSTVFLLCRVPPELARGLRDGWVGVMGGHAGVRACGRVVGRVVAVIDVVIRYRNLSS